MAGPSSASDELVMGAPVRAFDIIADPKRTRRYTVEEALDEILAALDRADYEK